MEKTTTTSKSRNKLFKLLQKAVRNLPRKNKKADTGVAEKSSGSVLPVPKTATDGGQMVKSSSFGEPISPKISCMGQIKYRKKMSKHIHLFLHKEMCPAIASKHKGTLMKPGLFLPEAEKIPSNMRNTHNNNNNNGFLEHIGRRKSRLVPSGKAPCLNQMKKFASFHGGELSDFDWRIAQNGLDDDTNESKYYYSDGEEEEEKDEVKIPFSGPLIWVGGRDYEVQELEPRKEVNLWKRRTTDPLPPLQISPPCTSLTTHRFRCW